MISLTAEYALRAVVCLAGHPGEPRTARALAGEAELPVDYASKVLKELARAHLVRGRRGQGGGYELARGPDEIRVLDVVSAVDPIRRIESCPLGRPEHEELCPLHRRLDAAARMVEEAFGATTIADLIREERGGLCAGPE